MNFSVCCLHKSIAERNPGISPIRYIVKSRIPIISQIYKNSPKSCYLCGVWSCVINR